MCGICASVIFTKDGQIPNHFDDASFKHLQECLKRRGPDSFNEVVGSFKEKFHLYFSSSVLHLRGSKLTVQPITDKKENSFMWNGEIFTEDLIGAAELSDMSDTHYIAKRMFSSSNASDILHVLKEIEGPYAFIYYDASGFLWFGRDVFGRRSLLWNFKKSMFQLSSVAVNFHGNKWKEVPAAGIFCLDLNMSMAKETFVLHQYNWCVSASGSCARTLVELPVSSAIGEIKCETELTAKTPISRPLNRSLPLEKSLETFLHVVTNSTDCRLAKQDLFLKLLEIPDFKEAVNSFERVLSSSVKKRVQCQLNCCKECYLKTPESTCIQQCNHSYVGVLFSGGLDSLVIAYLANRYVDSNSSIDLLNVAFSKESKAGSIAHGTQYDTPDRITGKMGFQALKRLFPSRRWNFVEINVTDSELNLKRVPHISELLYPSCSVLDDSIGCALWFASQGKGYILAEGEFLPYQSPARVLLVGMGADEQLAGYTRHRAVFKNSSWLGLIDEISLELDRIGARNLGRDDRIIGDNGVESRYPFLDENVVSFLNSLPIWLKANLNLERGIGEKLLLRLLAYKLGLAESAMLPKRAIQFGSRIAKLENSKEKGSDVCTRLLSTTS